MPVATRVQYRDNVVGALLVVLSLLFDNNYDDNLYINTKPLSFYFIYININY